MNMKKIISLFLALIMLLALCACKADWSASQEPSAEPEAVETAAPSPTSEPEPPAEPLDFSAAFAAYDPEETVFYVDGSSVTWRELFYEIVYVSSAIAAREGKAITSWDAPCALFTNAQGEAYPYGEVVLQNAIAFLEQYHIVENRLAEAGVTLGEDELAAVAAMRQQAIDESFGGDEAAFEAYLASMFCTEELWNWFNQVDVAYNLGFVAFYGEMGCDYPDEAVLEYANGDEGGLWTEYVQLKMIGLPAEEEPAAPEETAEPEETASQEASAEPAEEELTLAETILAELNKAEDKDEAFARLFDQYNEEAGLAYFPDGWCVYQGDTAEEIYQAALNMDDYDCCAVSLDDAAVIVMKVPLQPDGAVKYDVSTDTCYTLRYFAAMQDYATLVNGEDGWIAQGSADASWAPGFEGFTLASVF